MDKETENAYRHVQQVNLKKMRDHAENLGVYERSLDRNFQVTHTTVGEHILYILHTRLHEFPMVQTYAKLQLPLSIRDRIASTTDFVQVQKLYDDYRPRLASVVQYVLRHVSSEDEHFLFLKKIYIRLESCKTIKNMKELSDHLCDIAQKMCCYLGHGSDEHPSHQEIYEDSKDTNPIFARLVLDTKKNWEIFDGMLRNIFRRAREQMVGIERYITIIQMLTLMSVAREIVSYPKVNGISIPDLPEARMRYRRSHETAVKVFSVNKLEQRLLLDNIKEFREDQREVVRLVVEHLPTGVEHLLSLHQQADEVDEIPSEKERLEKLVEVMDKMLESVGLKISRSDLDLLYKNVDDFLDSVASMKDGVPTLEYHSYDEDEGVRQFKEECRTLLREEEIDVAVQTLELDKKMADFGAYATTATVSPSSSSQGEDFEALNQHDGLVI